MAKAMAMSFRRTMLIFIVVASCMKKNLFLRAEDDINYEDYDGSMSYNVTLVDIIKLEEGMAEFIYWADRIPEIDWPLPVPTWIPEILNTTQNAICAIGPFRARCDNRRSIESTGNNNCPPRKCVEFTEGNGIKYVECGSNQPYLKPVPIIDNNNHTSDKKPASAVSIASALEIKPTTGGAMFYVILGLGLTFINYIAGFTEISYSGLIEAF